MSNLNFSKFRTSIILTLVNQFPEFVNSINSLFPDGEPVIVPTPETNQFFFDTMKKNMAAVSMSFDTFDALLLEIINANDIWLKQTESLIRAGIAIQEKAQNTYHLLWKELHTRPELMESPEIELEWLNEFGKRIPCVTCSNFWFEYLKTQPADLSSCSTYKNWTFGVHNAVNAKLKKPIMPLDEAHKLYPQREVVIFTSTLCPGDITMLTAAVRDLHRNNPGKFITGVDTTCSDLWDHNPNVTKLTDSQKSRARIIPCHYPLINQSNQRANHFIEGYAADISEKLGVPIDITEFKGDIHLSQEEKSWISQVAEITGDNRPYWLVAAGGKYDFTIKWWEHKRYQEVVDHFQGKIQFVQVGDTHHCHLPLKGVIDLRGKTTLRQLVRLVHHSEGVLSPVTSVMHLAAAVECKKPLETRPCVVIAGGREPLQWEQYPGHQFIHTIGALPCCATGGCWRARTVPLNDGDEKDKSLCVNLGTSTLPKCMSMITSAEVIRRIEMYYTGGVLKYL